MTNDRISFVGFVLLWLVCGGCSAYVDILMPQRERKMFCFCWTFFWGAVLFLAVVTQISIVVAMSPFLQAASAATGGFVSILIFHWGFKSFLIRTHFRK